MVKYQFQLKKENFVLEDFTIKQLVSICKHLSLFTFHSRKKEKCYKLQRNKQQLIDAMREYNNEIYKYFFNFDITIEPNKGLKFNGLRGEILREYENDYQEHIERLEEQERLQALEDEKFFDLMEAEQEREFNEIMN